MYGQPWTKGLGVCRQAVLLRLAYQARKIGREEKAEVERTRLGHGSDVVPISIAIDSMVSIQNVWITWASRANKHGGRRHCGIVIFPDLEGPANECNS